MAQQERDYTGSGSQEGGSGLVYLSHRKNTATLTPTKEALRGFPRNHICAFFDSVELVFDDGNAEQKIAPCWKLRLKFSAEDSDLGTAESEGARKIAKYAMDIRQTNRSFMGTLLNRFCNLSQLDWDGKIKIGVSQKDGQPNATLYIKPTWEGKSLMPELWAWDDAEMCHKGVPRGRKTGNYDNNGQEVIDNTERDNFYLLWAKKLHEKFNGFPAPNIPPVENKGYRLMGVTAATIAAGSTQAPPATPAAAPTGPSSPIDKFWLAFDAKIGTITTVEIANDFFGKINGHIPTGVNTQSVIAKIIVQLSGANDGKMYTSDINNVISLAFNPTIDTSTAATNTGDDLPF